MVSYLAAVSVPIWIGFQAAIIAIVAAFRNVISWVTVSVTFPFLSANYRFGCSCSGCCSGRTRFANTSVLFMNSDAELGPIELCAGKKTAYPKMKVFIRKKLRKVSQGGKRYVFKYKEDKINTVRVIHK